MVPVAGKNEPNPWVSGIKHVAGNALKYAAYGAIVFAAGPLLVGALPWFSAMNVGVIAGLQYGAAAGGLLGAVTAVPGIEDAIKRDKMDSVYMQQQNMVFQQKQQLMAQQASLGAGMAAGAGQMLTPNVGYAQQQGQGGYRNI